MQVQTMTIWPGISLVVIQEGAGWRFSSWNTYTGRLAAPPDDECTKWFATVEDAAAHFRALCPRWH